MPNYYDGEPGAMSYDRERQPRRERAERAEGCDFCGNPIGLESVTVAGKGKWCSRDCRNAHAGKVYMAKQRRTG